MIWVPKGSLVNTNTQGPNKVGYVSHKLDHVGIFEEKMVHK